MRRPTLAALLTLALAAPAAAQWPTTDWTIRDSPSGTLSGVPVIGGQLDVIASAFLPPIGERAVFAAKHEGILEGAGLWFQSLGFPAPFQVTDDFDLTVEPGDAYLAVLKRDAAEIGSEHYQNGGMELTTHPGFLTADTPIWTLMEASAVHELYHGIQKGASRSLRQAIGGAAQDNAACPEDTPLAWFTEGTAAMVQVRWLEGKAGVPYGHPFLGSHRAAWVREFDQPLVRGALPPEHRTPRARPAMTSTETVSWACDYGTWYLWYAIGDMIGRTPEETVAYTRFLLDGDGPWSDGGVATVDAGLKEAAAAYDAIEPYRGGLYDLYPEFVAQYLTHDRFYGALEEVELAAPGLYETAAVSAPLGPLAARAWRVRVRLPADASPIPYNVRFTLAAEGGTDRDALHLIVGDDVAGRPADDAAPYTAVERTDYAEPGPDGTVEYLVRVANVAEEAAATEAATFSLRVEVDGFYGDAGPTPGEVGGALPPGFAVNGPGPWACRGGRQSRAVFDLMTPDELGRDVDRMLPEMALDVDEMFEDLQIMRRRLEQQGRSTGMSRAELDTLRAQARRQIAAAQAEHRADIGRVADEARGHGMTQLLATFVGQEGGAECQVTLAAHLAGREGGAQIIPGAVAPDLHPPDEVPGFAIQTYPASVLAAMRSGPAGLAGVTQGAGAFEGWEICTMTADDRARARADAEGRGCPAVTCTAGQLVLERAEQGRVAGSFQFEVLKWPAERAGRCRQPESRDTVTGHFNVASTDDGYDDNSLSGLSLGGALSGGVPIVPGAPILNLFDDE